jgi:hypothetical protein
VGEARAAVPNGWVGRHEATATASAERYPPQVVAATTAKTGALACADDDSEDEAEAGSEPPTLLIALDVRGMPHAV